MIAYLVVRLILAFPSLAPLAVRLLDRAVPRFRRIARDNLLKAGYPNPDPIIDGVFRSITRIIQTFADFPKINAANVQRLKEPIFVRLFRIVSGGSISDHPDARLVDHGEDEKN